jgi:signal transduction histidine kinase
MTALSSLTNRIFLASALLVVVSMGIVIYRVNDSVARQAERDLQAGLAEAASLVDLFSQSQFEDFLDKGRLVAEIPHLGAAASTDHPPTVQPIAEEVQGRIDADLLVVFGTGDRVLARVGRILLTDEELEGILAACRARRDGIVFWPLVGGIVHVAAMPIGSDPVRMLLVGLSLDRDDALSIKRLTNSEVAFVSGTDVVASSLDPIAEHALASVAGLRDVFTLVVGSEEYIGRVQPLSRSEDADEPIALVLRSRTERLGFLPALRWQIALTGLAAVLVATVVGYLVARSVTRPLRALTGAMGEMATTGDLARTLPAMGRWDDEDVRLVATTFRQLTGALDRFQREAAIRERLSSLGRLSTVVAHEIRNPLMIIKSAVRQLRKHDSPDVADTATSIDEEVARLNRVVTGVLDFARPITFAFTEGDLGAICRDAAQAAAADAADVPIEVTAGNEPIVTDVERLRAVLVNLLNNAQQAVQRRADGARSAIRLETLHEMGRWRITVVDRGTGISHEDLPHIFDPFFTTRRNGSGLGLAISKNVVEGLGGSLRVESRVGDGTTVTVYLPDRALRESTR